MNNDKITKIEMLEQNRKNALAPYYEIQNDRMQRYFDCQDDTILGGISDQVTSDTISKINRGFDLAIEQELNGGFLVRSEKTIALFKNGVMVSDKICSGKFGLFFVLTDNSFVSVAKKKATFDKKGFDVRVIEIDYKCNYVRISDKGFVIYNNIEEISNVERDFDFSTDSFSTNTNWISYLKNN
jgi:hypothetical protein